MNTTAIFSELLVTGIMTITWIVLFFLGLIDINLIISITDQYQIILSLLFLAYSYAVGIVFDRVWDYLTKPIDLNIRKKLNITSDELNLWRKNIFTDNTKTFFIEYIRSRIRISRSCFCNTIMFIIMSNFFIINKSYKIAISLHITLNVFLIIFSLFALYSFIKLQKNYYKQIKSFGLPSN